jgi:crotonobetainyl-CoA:carnitine CoA-transferase CaiB-like acyl-CoA transferase
MCRALERDDLIDDPRFQTVTARVKNVAERRAITSAEIEKWPSQEILERLDREGVPCAPILTRTDLLDDAQVRENAILEIHDDPRLGKVRQPRPAARFDRTPAKVRRMAPLLGAHNAEILRELGYSNDDVDRLTREGVLKAQSVARK